MLPHRHVQILLELFRGPSFHWAVYSWWCWLCVGQRVQLRNIAKCHIDAPHDSASRRVKWWTGSSYSRWSVSRRGSNVMRWGILLGSGCSKWDNYRIIFLCIIIFQTPLLLAIIQNWALLSVATVLLSLKFGCHGGTLELFPIICLQNHWGTNQEEDLVETIFFLVPSSSCSISEWYCILCDLHLMWCLECFTGFDQ